MKANILVLLTLLSSITVIAQSKFQVGLKAGFNISTFNRDDLPAGFEGFDRSSRGSLAGGITLDQVITPRFVMGAELLYNTRGMNYRERNNNIPVTVEQGQQKRSYNYLMYHLDYLELPLTAAFNFLPQKSKSKLSAYTGVAPAVLLHRRQKLDYDAKASPLKDQSEELQNTRVFENNFLAGIKLLEKETIGFDSYIDVRCNISLSPIFSNRDTGMTTYTLAFGIILP